MDLEGLLGGEPDVGQVGKCGGVEFPRGRLQVLGPQEGAHEIGEHTDAHHLEMHNDFKLDLPLI